MKSQSTLEDLAHLSDDELLLMLGKHLHGRGALTPPPKALMEASVQWLNAQRDHLAQIVCASSQVQDIARKGEGTGRRLEIAAAIADTIIGIHKGMPVAVIGLLLAKESMHTFCQKYWP